MLTISRWFLVALPMMLGPSCSEPASGQQITRTEVGIGWTYQTNTNFPGTQFAYRSDYTGPFARVTLNLNRSVALEASGFDSINQIPSYNKVGGHQALILGGVKVGLRRRYFGVFGRLDAGVASYSRGLEFFEVQNGQVLNVPPLFYRETHFALEPGATVGAYISKRAVIRADVDENLNAVFRTVHVLGPNLTQVLGGFVPHHLGASLSVERRLGHFDETRNAPLASEGFSIGAYFPLQIREQFTISNAPALGGGGAWIGIPLAALISADVVAFDLPHDDHTAGIQDGGTPFSFFAGPKFGVRAGRFGLFAKVRPGMTRFSRTVSSLTIASDGEGFIVNHPQYQFGLDTGGVFEYTAARHVLVRLEAGDNLTFYHSHGEAYSYPGSSGVAIAPAMHSSSMLFLAGVGYRF